MQLSQIMNPKFQELLNKLLTAEVPMKTAFKLRKIQKNIDEALKNYDTTRIESIKKFAELDEEGNIKADENGNATFASSEDRIKFSKELSELLSLEVDIDKILIDDLGDTLLLSAVDVSLLEDIIE